MPYIVTRGRAMSAPLAGRFGMSVGSGVANPRAAVSDGNEKNEGGRNVLTIEPIRPSDTDIYCLDCEMWLQKPVASAPIALPDREKKEVGNPLRAGGSGTANQRDRSNSVDATDVELAMIVRLSWAEGKTVLIHCNRGEHRAPSAVEQVDNLRQRSLGGVVQSGRSGSSSGRGRVANPEHAVVPVTDWYAPHLREDAVTSPLLFIGGGTTGVAAVCDERPHRFLAQRRVPQQSL